LKQRLARDGASPTANLVTPAYWEVHLIPPNGNGWVAVGLNSDGRLRHVRAEKVRGRYNATPVEAANLLNAFTGSLSARFRLVTDDARQGPIRNWLWELEDAGSSVKFSVAFEGDSIRAVQPARGLSQPLADEYRALQASLGLVIQVAMIVGFLAIAFLNAAFFRGLVTRAIPLRPLVSWSLLAAVFILLGTFGGENFRRILLAAAGALPPVVAALVASLTTVLAMLILCFGAGRAIAPDPARWFTLEALLLGRVALQPVGASIAWGIAWSGWLAGSGHIFGALGLSPIPASFAVTNYGAPLPWTTAFDLFARADGVPFILFLSQAFWRPSRLRWLYAFCGLVLTWGLLTVVRDIYDFGPVWSMAASAVYLIGLTLLVRFTDQLTALTAWFSFNVLQAVAIFGPTGAPGFHQTAWILAGSLGITFAVFAFVALRGRPVDIASEVEAAALQRQKLAGPDRQRLKAEFHVARMAQQEMLPQVPERVDQFTLAASCLPAREVGGDLYDWFRAEDGRYGVCVADVSGKGVPAALYMSLTKGYLAAASSEAADLRMLLSDLNQLLYQAGKKKVFVTMAFGWFDPREGVIEMARAGHNPVLWRRASRGESVYCQPPGLGLGITSRLLFERNLKTERLQLEPGDAVVFYSDGITEAMNKANEQFGEDRLMAALERCDGWNAADTEAEILRQVRLFMGAEPPHDDMTVFVLRA
jgi:serine phosphatase RsbU (regulator of sigma subunit)